MLRAITDLVLLLLVYAAMPHWNKLGFGALEAGLNEAFGLNHGAREMGELSEG